MILQLVAIDNNCAKPDKLTVVLGTTRTVGGMSPRSGVALTAISSNDPLLHGGGGSWKQGLSENGQGFNGGGVACDGN